MSDYKQFIASKTRKLKPLGFAVPQSHINGKLFDWQVDVVRWAALRGRAALFEECGLGKTLQQLEWSNLVVKHTGKPVILHCPIGVRQQTKREAAKFKIATPVEVVDEPSQVIDGINLVNYEKLHLFDVSQFAGVVLDESSILKNYTSKRKRQLCEVYKDTPFRLACTATPAPNDHMELGNHAEFLGVMPSNEMLSRWFINDTMKAGGYRLRGHAQKDFWAWVASWAVCLSSPSDLGYSDEGFILPQLHEKEHVVTPPEREPDAGYLFAVDGISATTIHKEKRHSTSDRAAKVAELVNGNRESWIVWCDTNYEADELKALIPDAIEVRGNDSDSAKESKLSAFSCNEARVIITKPEIAGFGMNWQHCRNVAFIGIGYSFERYYQAVRRSWRFGQTKPVNVHIVTTEAEYVANKTVQRKQSDFAVMQCNMAAAMRDASLTEIRGEKTRDDYQPTVEMELPTWLNQSA